MTNLQDVASPNATKLQQRLLLGVPIGIGAVVTALIIGFGVVPQWLRLQVSSESLAQLEEFKARIPLLRFQIAKTYEEQSAAERKQLKVLQLIEGSGEFVTFLAQLDDKPRCVNEQAPSCVHVLDKWLHVLLRS